MSERCGQIHQGDVLGGRELLARLASRQAGRVSRAQLAHLGIGRGQIEHWIEIGHLRKLHPRVYAVAHDAPSRYADLWASLLYAGPDAMLSHGTGAWWHELIDRPPAPIHVSTPRQIASGEKVRVHARRRCERTWHRGLPVTAPAQTVLDLAAGGQAMLVRKALGRLEFRGEFDAAALSAACGAGRPGSTLLKAALRAHDPNIARLNGRLEESFYAFCERHRIPLPLINVRVHGIKVDAFWLAQRLVVELDGRDNHRTWAQLKSDRAKELALRGHGIVTVRYDWALVHEQPLAVRDDLLAQLEARGWRAA